MPGPLGRGDRSLLPIDHRRAGRRRYHGVAAGTRRSLPGGAAQRGHHAGAQPAGSHHPHPGGPVSAGQRRSAGLAGAIGARRQGGARRAPGGLCQRQAVVQRDAVMRLGLVEPREDRCGRRQDRAGRRPQHVERGLSRCRAGARCLDAGAWRCRDRCASPCRPTVGLRLRSSRRIGRREFIRLPQRQCGDRTGLPGDDACRLRRQTRSHGTRSHGTRSHGTRSHGTRSQRARSQATQTRGTRSRATQSRGTRSRPTQSRGMRNPAPRCSPPAGWAPA
jgi:hypothetical protein